MIERSAFGLCILMTCMLFNGMAWAHPGWGIEVSEDGDVYFTDLVHVWIIDASGQTRIHVKDVHSHDLKLSADGHLYGSHEWYDASTEQFKRSYWVVDAAGKKHTIKPQQALPYLGIKLNNQHVMPHSNLHEKYTEFLPEAAGASLYRMPMGAVDGDISLARFGVFADWSTWGTQVFITSGSQIRRIDANNQVNTTLGKQQGFTYKDDTFSQLLGIDADSDGNLYVADFDRREFLKIENDGVSVVEQSGWSWAAAGVNHHNNKLYLLEASRLPLSGAVRVRVVNDNGDSSVLGKNHPSE